MPSTEHLPGRGTCSSQALPVVVGDDGCEGAHADPVTHQVDVFAQEVLTPAARTETITPPSYNIPYNSATQPSCPRL